MKAPLVSIIIPVFNAEAYLEETILSAMAQTWQNKEIIIINNGSTDNSLAITKKYEAENVRIFSQENAGASGARNRGVAEATGDFIQFLDADDLMNASKIERQLNTIVDSENAIAYGSFAVFTDARELPETTESYLNKDYKNGAEFLFDLYGGRDDLSSAGGMVPMMCWLTPRNVIEKAGKWNPGLSVDDDGDFFCRVVLSAGNINYVAGAKSYYRMHTHNKNLSSQSSHPAYMSAFNAIKLKRQYVNDKKFDTLFANHATQLLVNIYPNYRHLRHEIVEFIKNMGGNTWQPYREHPHKLLRQIFGWRFVKLIIFYKNK